jgi:hypothetical protein
MPTPEAAAMGRVVAASAGWLRGVGFKKRRHSFDRRTADGLVHVVTFWMAPKEPPAWTEVPGLRERRYGGFRIDLGVYVPEMTRMGVPRSDWINEYDCHLRTTIGRLITGDDASDLWWELADERSPDVAKAALAEHGLPWLDRFPDRDRLLEQFRASGPIAIGMGPAGDLDVAELLMALGRHDEARRVLDRYVDRPVIRSHAAYLTEYLPAIGRADLVSRIRIAAPED